MKAWLKNNKVVIDSFGRVILCDTCPCDEGTGTGTGTGGVSTNVGRVQGSATNDASYGTYAWEANIFSGYYGYIPDPNEGGASYNTNYLKVYNFGFSIPSGATITGIYLRVRYDSQTDTYDEVVRLMKAGTVVGDNKALGSDLNAEIVVFYPSGPATNDLWGETWTPADINDPDFGAVIAVNSTRDDPFNSQIVSVNCDPTALPTTDGCTIVVFYTL